MLLSYFHFLRIAVAGADAFPSFMLFHYREQQIKGCGLKKKTGKGRARERDSKWAACKTKQPIALIALILAELYVRHGFTWRDSLFLFFCRIRIGNQYRLLCSGCRLHRSIFYGTLKLKFTDHAL